MKNGVGIMKEENKNRKLNILLSNKGTTMLETLVAFVVLMIILGVLYNIIAFCSELRMSAADTNRAMIDFNCEIYAKSPNSSVVDIKECTVERKQPLFYLELSDKTSDANLGSGSERSSFKKKLSLYNVEAVTYAYHKEVDDTDTIAVPKAISFRRRQNGAP